MIEIIDSTASHTRELTKTLREEDKLEAIRLGHQPHKALFYTYHRGVYRKTGLIDGEVAAMWGVAGTPLSLVGLPYLVTGTKVLEISPVRFAKIYIREVQEMHKLFPILENYVDGEYTAAIRLLELAGFQIKDPLTVNNNLFYKFTRTI